MINGKIKKGRKGEKKGWGGGVKKIEKKLIMRKIKTETYTEGGNKIYFPPI